MLLPYDPVRDEVVLIEQLRIAAVDTSNSPRLLEMVAGMIETGESVEERVPPRSAGRGRRGGRALQAGAELSGQPGGTSERLSIMVGEVDAGTAEGIHGPAEEHEDIRVHVVGREQAYRWVEGAIDNAASVITCCGWRCTMNR